MYLRVLLYVDDATMEFGKKYIQEQTQKSQYIIDNNLIS